ncbi:MAG: ABC transporter permease [Chloroflexi bacterium]|nr:ABC transporter permease [Chloroflexota bacterium]
MTTTLSPEKDNPEGTPSIMHRASAFRRFFSARETGVFIALILMCLLLTFTSPNFLTVKNLLNIGRQVSLLGIMAVGMTFVLIAKEIDLSIGSIYALVGLGVGILLTYHFGVFPAIVFGLLLGATLGFVNGWLSTYGQLPSFITTLGMLSAVRGIALLITNGQPVTINEAFGISKQVIDQFYFLGQGQLFGIIPMQLVFFILVLGIGYVVLSRTVLGFQVYAVGGNEKAARVSGIRTKNVKIMAFVMMGILAGLSGILSLAFLPSGQAGRTGLGLELDVIAAAVIGGASLAGGEGTMLGTLIGVLIMGVLRNGLVLLGISPFWQTTIIGLVIVLAVGVDKWSRSKRAG